MNTNTAEHFKVSVNKGSESLFEINVCAGSDIEALVQAKAHIREHHPKLAKRIDADRSITFLTTSSFA